MRKFAAFDDSVVLIARLLLSLIFVVEGWLKISDYAGTQVAYMEANGVTGVLLPLVILTELGGGLLVAFGLFARLAAVGACGILPAHRALLSHDAGPGGAFLQEPGDGRRLPDARGARRRAHGRSMPGRRRGAGRHRRLAVANAFWTGAGASLYRSTRTWRGHHDLSVRSRGAAVLAALLAGGCQTGFYDAGTPSPPPIGAGPTAMDGIWASTDGVFVANFQRGRFTSRFTRPTKSWRKGPTA